MVMVAVLTPILLFIRLCDGNEPSLADAALSYHTAHTDAVAAARSATSGRVDTKFANLPAQVDMRFNSRRNDCNDELSLAAAMINPKIRYSMIAAVANFSPDGGYEAIMKAIRKYYQGDEDTINLAMLTYSNFRSKSGSFFSEKLASISAQRESKGDFWASAATHREPDGVDRGCKLFRLLQGAYIGQGGAERRNKDVKYVRTKTRNRQSHIVNEAYVFLKVWLRMKWGLQKKATKAREDEKMTYLDHCQQRLQDGIDDAEEYRILQEEEAMEAAEAANARQAAQFEEVADDMNVGENNEENEIGGEEYYMQLLLGLRAYQA